MIACRERVFESSRIGADKRRVEHHLITAGDDRVFAECAAKVVDRLAEGVAGVRCVELRPEESDEAVASMEAVGPREVEVEEQGEALGLRQNFDQLTAILPAEIDAAQSAKLYQGSAQESLSQIPQKNPFGEDSGKSRGTQSEYVAAPIGDHLVTQEDNCQQ